jgi:tetratricopeptide (TPR) repeat protein
VDATRYLATYEKLGGAREALRLERDLARVQRGEIGEIDVRFRATIDPDHPDVLFILEALAQGYLTAERWADARQACALWRGIQPDHPRPWYWGGWISERLVQLDQAAELYRRAVELDPESREVRVALGRVLARQRSPDAVACYEWVLARHPDDAEALLGLAMCRIAAGRSAEALGLIERVMARDPYAPQAAALRGRALLEGGDPAGAEPWLRQAVRAEPSDSEALHQLVLCLRQERKDAEAEELGRRLESLRTDLKRLTELLRTITSPLTDAAPCHEAGVIALRIGRTQQGLNLLQDALRRKGDHRATHAALAAHFRQVGNTDLARHHQGLADSP